VQLPVGLAGGKISTPLSGKLIFRDWYRTRMIMRVDLATGKEEANLKSRPQLQPRNGCERAPLP
jgi:hypothetical protein